MYEPSVADQRLFTLRRPLGVVGLITPWNFPIAIPVWKLAPALIYGNTRRPQARLRGAADGAPRRRVLRRGRAAAQACSTCSPARARRSAPRSSRTPACARSRSPGSVPVGRSVRDEATARDCRVQLELGGHNPLIVTAAAELDRAVEAAYAGAFWSAGQKCTATRRILVEDSVYDAFREKLLARVAAGKVGDPADPEVEVGPVVNEGAMEEILARDRAGAQRGRHRARGRRARRRRRLPRSRRPSSRGSPTTPSSRARRCSGP